MILSRRSNGAKDDAVIVRNFGSRGYGAFHKLLQQIFREERRIGGA